LSVLREYRTKANVTQVELANKVGVKPNAISQYESGVRSPKIKIGKKIAAVLGFDWKLLYEDDEGGETDGRTEGQAV